MRLSILISALLFTAACTEEKPSTTLDASEDATSTSGDTTTLEDTTATSSSDMTANEDSAEGDATEGDTTAADATTTQNDATTSSGADAEADVPPLEGETCAGYATRYWDCCKAHCGWQGNVPEGVNPVTSCDMSDDPLAGDFNATSACDGGSAHTCNSMAPWSVSDTLSYGFAAVPATGDICGRCYQLEFDGTSHNAQNDAGSAALSGKTMIVQATNIGYDVGNGQFDILIPGGGVGAFNACSNQWGVATSELGAQYGGFLLKCKEDAGFNSTHEEDKACVQARCEAVFAELPELQAACAWFVDWYEVADNPALRYREVVCPQAIVDVSGVDRRPLDDVSATCGGSSSGGTCTQEEQDACNCDWTQGGTQCGADDGSCCWKACCGS